MLLLRILLLCLAAVAARAESAAEETEEAEGAEAACVIELECEACLPEHMPLVTAPRAARGRVRLAAGETLALSCGAGRLLAYPQRAALEAACEAGRYRVRHDRALLHLLDLGCQRSVFQDTPHQVEHCAAPLQGRAYQVTEADSGGVRHLAAVCFDEERGVATLAHTSTARALRLPPHEDGAPLALSLLGGLRGALGAGTLRAAARLYADDARATRRLRELLAPDRVALADQALAAAVLLAPGYFEAEHARAAAFASNKVVAWRAVAAGNLRHAQLDVARLLRRARPHRELHVYAGTHGVATVRTANATRALALGGARFPVPRYVWTVVADAAAGRALALVVLNEPLVAVSEVRERVFCESQCARVRWARELRHARRYETPAYGLAFCCGAHELAARVRELPAPLLQAVRAGDAGLLLDLDLDLRYLLH